MSSASKYIEMSQKYLEKSDANLQAAERDFRHRSYDPCASRAYFAVFHAALAALLALTDFYRQGKGGVHRNVAAEFVGRLIHRRKVFPRAMAGVLDDLRVHRHLADYDDRSVSRKHASQSLSDARRFIRQIRAELPKEN